MQLLESQFAISLIDRYRRINDRSGKVEVRTHDLSQTGCRSVERGSARRQEVAQFEVSIDDERLQPIRDDIPVFGSCHCFERGGFSLMRDNRRRASLLEPQAMLILLSDNLIQES